MIDEQVQKDSLRRLKKIEGQVKGIQRMVEQRKYCIDIINQITAVRRALDVVSLKVMRRHLQSCVTEAIKQNRPQEKIDELMETIYKFVK